jgi:cell division protein FtsI (penicillin-binding protein 3)
LRNRAAQDLYEFGSVFKPFAAAAALEFGVVGPQTLIDARGPLYWNRRAFRDHYRMPEFMTVADMIAKSSNVATARAALMVGAEPMQGFLADLGLMEPTGLELPEAAQGRPAGPQRWSGLSTITISFGYGLNSTQAHLAAAYATVVNGGLRVRPTLDPDAQPPGEEARVLSPRTSEWMRDALRATVERGTGKSAEAPGYRVGGKTGTANKLRRDGPGYDETRTLASFVGVFPVDDPAYVLAVTVDEGEDRSGPVARRGGGSLAAPAAGEAIRRLAPMLGLRPAPEPAGHTLTALR